MPLTAGLSLILFQPITYLGVFMNAIIDYLVQSHMDRIRSR